MTFKVAVVGAGVIGCSTAFVVKRDNPEYHVTLIAENFSPNVTSDGAPGIFYPGEKWNAEHPELERQWTLASLDWLKKLQKEPTSFQFGITKCSGYCLYDGELMFPDCRTLYPDFRIVQEKELSCFPSKIKSGFFFTSYLCESSKYLPFLLRKFQEMGGEKKQRAIKTFAELQDYDVIVNCTGMGAIDLCQDEKVYPIRGQITRVKAPWIRHFYKVTLRSEGKNIYIYPNIDFVVLGGTGQVGDFNLNVSEEDKRMILHETSLVVPSLKTAEELCDWVGLRPGRPSVRLELEEIALDNGKKIKIVHNYGHARLGVTLHYGCALDASKLVKECAEMTRKEFLNARATQDVPRNTGPNKGELSPLRNDKSKL